MRVYSVSEFNREVNTLLSDITITLQGEVSGFNISQNRFVWFDLKDDKSRVSCFLMVFNLKVELEDGMEIQVIGSPGLSLKSGGFKLTVKDIKPVGEGSLKKQFELLKKKLQKEGLFDADRKRELPRFPQKIGIVTSPGAAAYTDVLRILKNRWSGLDITLFPTQVQGDAAPGHIIKALDQAQQDDLDVIILTRGGGSIEDLQAFNNEEVCRAVFGSSIPVVAGIGHERDEALVDFVADQRAATPSNAAELVVPHKKDVIFQIEQLINTQERKIDELLEGKKDLINNFSGALDLYIDQLKQKIDHSINLLNSYNPQQVLSRGYSITRYKGKVVKDSKKVPKGSLITTQLAKGELKAKTN